MRRTRGWAARGPASLHMVELERRDLRPEDIALRVDYCGVCHSDLHALHEYAQRTAGAESSEDPFVPGHECTGTVTEVGTEVTRFAVGDTVAVGNIVDACLRCDMCTAGHENYCREFPTLTYGGVDRHDGTPTRGAFARELVVREEFAHHLPPGLDPAAAAPLLCAGITVWEPLRALAVSSGTRLAVVGLGGLGHLAVKLAVALGAEVTVLSRSAAKADDARRLGAHHLLVSTDEVAMTRARGSFDVVLDTVAVAHDLAPLLELLTLDGTLSQVGYLGPISLETLSLHMGWALTSSCCPPRASTMPSRDSPGVTCATGSCSTCRISSPTRPGSPHPRLLPGSELLEVVGEQAVAVGQGGGVLPEPGQQEGGEPGGRRGDHARRGEADTGQPHRHRHYAGRSIQGGEGEFGDLAMGGRPRPADVQVPCRAVLELFADRCREVGAIDRRDLCPPAADHEGDAPLGHREIGAEVGETSRSVHDQVVVGGAERRRRRPWRA